MVVCLREGLWVRQMEGGEVGKGGGWKAVLDVQKVAGGCMGYPDPLGVFFYFLECLVCKN